MNTFFRSHNILLRIALAFAFLYAAVSAWIIPSHWVGYIPPFVRDVSLVSPEVLLHAVGVFEILIALWFLWGRKIFVPSVLAAGFLFGIALFNIAQLPVVFRDIALGLVAVHLAFEAFQGNTVNTKREKNVVL